MIPGLLRTLLSIVLVWFVFRWLDRMFSGNRNRNRNGNGNRNRGGGRKPDDNRVGEYVDYEEIDN